MQQETLRILIITASLPYPPASGGAIRVYGILHGLHAAGHHITLFSLVDGDAAPDHTPLHDICERIITQPAPARKRTHRLRDLLFTMQADIARRLYNNGIRDTLLALVRENDFDIIQFEGIEVACYLPGIKATHPNALLVFDTFNAEADLQRVIFNIDKDDPQRWPAALYSRIQSGRIRQYEGDLCRAADVVIAVSPEDAALLRPYRSDERVYIVPSGIFVDDYATSETDIDLPDNALVFTGKMDYRPNVDAMMWFGHHILPQLDHAHLVIVGQKPHSRIQQLAQRPNVTITGWVDAIPPYLHAADVYIAPLRMGSGTRLKILEAMAAQCAIVATPIAASGLSDEAKQAMVIADDTQTITNAINDLLQHTHQRRTLGEKACAAVKAHYDWSVLIPRLLAVYDEARHDR